MHKRVPIFRCGSACFTYSSLVPEENGRWIQRLRREAAELTQLNPDQRAALLGDPVVSPLEFAPEMPTSRGYGKSLVGALRLAAADLQYCGALLANPLTVATFEQFVLTGLLLSQPHNYREALLRRAKPVAPADVRRAVDFIEANVDAPIGL